MAKITRKNQKILGLNSSANGQFGSARAGTFVLDNDPDVIQALPAWELGWFEATMSSDQLPCLEEFQAVQYVITRQMAYFLQQGIPEYGADTTYYTNSICVEEGTLKLYASLTDDNVGNPLSDGANWKLLIDYAIGVEADKVSFDDTGTNLDADNVQDALEAVDNRAMIYNATATGTNTITLTCATIPALVTGMIFIFNPQNANTNTSVTANPNGLGAKTVVKNSPNGTGTVPLAVGDLTTAPAWLWYNGTDLVLLNPMGVYGASHPSAIASASTVDLSALQGDAFQLSGTTPVNAVTLAQGRRAVGIATGAVPLVNGANLILPGNANYTCAVGDMLMFRGEAAGVVRVFILKADGTPVVAPVSDMQIFTASGTWNKPAGFSPNSSVLIRGWGGGAGGSDSGSSHNSGGGGGAYWERRLRLSQMGATETVTVGAGGLAVENAQGQPGGDSSVGTLFTVYGGTNGTSGNSSVGGAGGSPFGRSANGTRTPVADSILFYPLQGYGRPLSGSESTSGLYNGGGGGGPGAGASPGGSSVFGGGGGGGGNGTLSQGGLSTYGGRGGNGQGATQAEMNGTVPGGGGGGLYTSQPMAGNGARGQIEITVFR